MVPQSSPTHNLYQLALLDALRPIARRLGLETYTEGALYVPLVDERNYRVPDLTFARSDQRSQRGLEGAELVIEVLSPDDESRAKLPFFARAGVREVWLADPQTRSIELLELVDGSHIRVPPIGGVLRSRVLAVELRVALGPRLEIRDGDVTVAI
jgi:Uma2 family endonuclease